MILDRRKFAGRDYQVESIVCLLYTYNNNNNKNPLPPTLVTPSEYLWIRNNNNIKYYLFFFFNEKHYTCTQHYTINSEKMLLKHVIIPTYRYVHAYRLLLRCATDRYADDQC